MSLKTQGTEQRKNGILKKVTAPILLFDLAVLIIMAVLLFWGAAWRPDAQSQNSESWQFFRPYTDVAKYECYVTAFVHGLPALKQFSPEQCDFITHPDPSIKYITREQIIQEMQKYHLPQGLVQLVQM